MIRIIARLLPLIIALLIAIPLWDYFGRSRDAGSPEALTHDPLPGGVALKAEGLQWFANDGGETIYRVRAAEMLENTEKTKTGNNVEVEIYPRQPGDPTRRIHGDRCSHDQTSNDILCTGNVNYQLNENTFGHTEQLRYIHSLRIIESAVRTDIEQPGRMNGDAGNLTYVLDSNTLNLTGDVHINLTQGGMLNGGAAVFNQDENWATVSDGIEVRSPNGWIRGTAGRADLEPGTYRPTRVTVQNSVTAESTTSGGPDKWRLQADWLQSDLSLEGNIQNVLARTNARVDRTSSAGAESLTGTEVHGQMDESGQLSHVEATGSPEFQSTRGRLRAQQKIGIDSAGTISTQGMSTLDPAAEPGGVESAEARRITADTGLIIDPKGTIVTQGRSTLKAAASEIEGRDFVIEQKPNVHLFTTMHRAILTFESEGRRMEGDATSLQIDARNNEFLELEQTGNVKFREGAREGEAQKLTIRNGGDTAILEGNARITDGPIFLSGRQVTLHRSKEAIEAAGNIITIDSSSRNNIVTVHAGRVQVGQDRFEYWDNVRIIRDGGEIRADHVVGHKGGQGFNAEGNVVSRNLIFEAAAESLVFSESAEGRTARYTGKVRAQKKDTPRPMTLETRDMTVILTATGDIARIESRGGVVVTRGLNVGTGVEAVYVAATGETVLRGSDTVDAVVKGPEGSASGYVIRTDSQGRVASAEPSRIDGRGNLSTSKDRLKR